MVSSRSSHVPLTLFTISGDHMRLLVFLISTSIFIAAESVACTSAVISGRATKDGRPLLWKQRDTGTLENTLVSSTGERYRFLGVHDLTDSTNAECFMGSNEVGFSIINTASYNLAYEKYKGKMDEEGVLMKKALGTCKTLADFEQLLNDTRGKRGVEANFGVIDAAGGAAYYETDPYVFKKFDANDSAVAPRGYLLRTNFSASGAPEDGQGYIRYQTATDLFQWAYLGEGLSVDFLLLEGTVCFRHSLVGTNLATDNVPESEDVCTMVNFADFIPRYSTSASMVIQGVKPGEDGALTTLWTVLGSPLTTPVVPVWVKYAGTIPSLWVSRGKDSAPVNETSLKLKARCFPLKTPEGKYYLDLAKVFNRRGTGTVQQLRDTDRKILRLGHQAMESYREKMPSVSDVRLLYAGIEKLVLAYFNEFGYAVVHQ
jgi:hypothetical protein